jgi:F0F1-type ATP synthase assembly protein I
MAVSEVVSTTEATAAVAKGFLVAHPVGVALVGGVLVGVATYWLMKKYFNKKEEPAPAAAAG